MRRLIVLMDGLPDDARSLRRDPSDEHWGTVEELLAQLVELTSVVAAERRLPEPRIVPRPFDLSPDPASPARTPNKPGPSKATGLGAATVEMAAWAERNGGIGGQGDQLVKFFAPTPADTDGWVPPGWTPDPVEAREVTGDA